MAKKSKDLFELLQMRARGGSAPAPRRPQPQREPVDLVGSVVGSVRQMLGRDPDPKSKRGKGKGKAKAKAAPPALPQVSMPGLLLAGVVLACLALGFVLGRATAGAGGGGDLRAPGSSGPRGVHRGHYS